MNRILRIPTATAALLLGVSLATTAGAAPGWASAAGPAAPTLIALPDGFAPEGIATGPGPYAYLGSLVDGSIYRADLRTGAGQVISKGPGTQSVGVKTDSCGRLFVAGGATGDARVVDTRTGAVLGTWQLATGTSFVNDVVLTPDAAYLTDSVNPVLYRLPLGRGGALPTAGAVQRIPLTGAISYTDGFNANGIARTPDGRALLVVQSNTGLLFRVDPATGVATKVDLGGASLVNGDGLLLVGRTLYVVLNQANLVVVVHLEPSGTAGTVVAQLTDPRFDVPTTVAAYGGRLYLPNARFTTEVTPTTPYSVVAIPARS